MVTNGFVGTRNAWHKAAVGFTHVMAQYQDWYGANTDPAATGKGRLATVTPAEAPPHFIVGTPDDCVQMLEPLCRLLAEMPGGGDGHVLIRLTYPGQDINDVISSVRLFGKEVIPTLRKVATAS